MLVGEQPGDQEDKQGHPFVGPAGGVLWRCLDDAGIDRESVYVTNAVKHFKHEDRGKRRLHKKPNTAEVEACHPWLEAELRAVDGRVIVALGATAARSLFGRTMRDRRQPRSGVRRSTDGRPSSRTTRRRCCAPTSAAAEIRSALVDGSATGSPAGRGRCVTAVTARAGRLFGLVVQGLARRRVPGRRSRSDAGSSTTSSCSTPSSSTPPSTGCPRPTTVEGWAAGGPPGLRLRGQARRVRLAPHEAARRRDRGCPTTSTGSSGSATTSARTSCSSRRAGSATSNGSTSSCRRAPSTIRWAVELRDRRGCTTTCSTCCAATAPRCASTTCCADHPFELTTDWTYVRFHGPDALEQPYHGAYGAARLCDVGRPTRRPCSTQGRDVYAYFNNDWYGHAVTDAKFLRDQLERRDSRPGRDLSDSASGRDLSGTVRTDPAQISATVDALRRSVAAFECWGLPGPVGYGDASCSDDVRRIRAAAAHDEGRRRGGDGVHRCRSSRRR